MGVFFLPGDRLRPSRLIRDVADFEDIALRKPLLPFRYLFWRVGNPKSARLLHHNPLKDIPGIGMESYAIDILHTWHMGDIPRYCGMAIWAVLRCAAYGADFPPYLFEDDKMHLNLMRLRSSDLWVHYKEMQAADPTSGT